MLNANALTTVARLSDFMGIDTPAVGSVDERRLEARINSISNFIERYVGMTFKKTTYTQEEYITERAQTLNLKHYPIVATEPIIIERRSSGLNEDGWETIDGEFYSVDMDAGIINAMASIFFFRGQNIYRITYTAGYDFNNTTTFLGDTPAGDIELALQLIAQDMQNASGSGGNVKSERIGDYQVTYQDVRGLAFSNADAVGILNDWKEIQMGAALTPLQSI